MHKVVGDRAAVDVAFLDPTSKPTDSVRIRGHANVRGRHREFAMAGEMSDEGFRAFLTQSLAAAAKISRDGAVHFICMDWRYMDDICAVGRSIYGDLLNLCVWNKSSAGMGSLYRSKHELVFVYRVGTAPHFDAVELRRHGRKRTSADALLHLVLHAGERLQDLDERWWQGTATGELLKVLFALYNTDPALASWNNAVTIAELSEP